mgnify:CR=1 FL=1
MPLYKRNIAEKEKNHEKFKRLQLRRQNNEELKEEMLKNYGVGKDAFEKYSAMDEDALISELIKSVTASKADGSYDPRKMTAFINAVSPSLTPEQREKLNNVVRIINGGM